jgi:ankyrin repeat protein
MTIQQDFFNACATNNLDEVNALLAKYYHFYNEKWFSPIIKKFPIGLQPTAQSNLALRYAARNGYLSIVDRLLQIPKVLEFENNVFGIFYKRYLNFKTLHVDLNSLEGAATNGHINIVNRLLQIPGVFKNASASNNYALRKAAKHGHEAVVKRLLEIPGVKKHINDLLNTQPKETAIAYAFEGKHFNIVELLKQHGATLPKEVKELKEVENNQVDQPELAVEAIRPAAPQAVLFSQGEKRQLQEQEDSAAKRQKIDLEQAPVVADTQDVEMTDVEQAPKRMKR